MKPLTISERWNHYDLSPTARGHGDAAPARNVAVTAVTAGVANASQEKS